jgi:hypothetical protein
MTDPSRTGGFKGLIFRALGLEIETEGGEEGMSVIKAVASDRRRT